MASVHRVLFCACVAVNMVMSNCQPDTDVAISNMSKRFPHRMEQWTDATTMVRKAILDSTKPLVLGLLGDSDTELYRFAITLAHFVRKSRSLSHSNCSPASLCTSYVVVDLQPTDTTSLLEKQTHMLQTVANYLKNEPEGCVVLRHVTAASSRLLNSFLTPWDHTRPLIQSGSSVVSTQKATFLVLVESPRGLEHGVTGWREALDSMWRIEAGREVSAGAITGRIDSVLLFPTLNSTQVSSSERAWVTYGEHEQGATEYSAVRVLGCAFALVLSLIVMYIHSAYKARASNHQTTVTSAAVAAEDDSGSESSDIVSSTDGLGSASDESGISSDDEEDVSQTVEPLSRAVSVTPSKQPDVGGPGPMLTASRHRASTVTVATVVSADTDHHEPRRSARLRSAAARRVPQH
eukprot:GILK01012287.1.p1 GENE.GILK01012287.1~~GILK01012287.1.p1  ORF type:complete len:419 (+),score=51.05 GILK01012287.1:37-1257(+)